MGGGRGGVRPGRSAANPRDPAGRTGRLAGAVSRSAVPRCARSRSRGGGRTSREPPRAVARVGPRVALRSPRAGGRARRRVRCRRLGPSVGASPSRTLGDHSRLAFSGPRRRGRPFPGRGRKRVDGARSSSPGSAGTGPCRAWRGARRFCRVRAAGPSAAVGPIRRSALGERSEASDAGRRASAGAEGALGGRVIRVPSRVPGANVSRSAL